MKSYDQTIRELFDLQKFSIKMGLDNIRQLCAGLGDPQHHYDTLHVAGTNGKGSTSVLIQALLTAHGISTGLYTSPHLVDFRERIRVDGSEIERVYVQRYWQEKEAEVEDLKATFFDTTTALAFDYFRSRGVDAAVIETGLGGRLDSTNILNPRVVVFTPVAIDHTKQLGHDLLGIAAEKAAIIKPGASVFCGRQEPRVMALLRQKSSVAEHFFGMERQARFLIRTQSAASTQFSITDLVRGEVIDDLEIRLGGRHQVENAVLAYLAARWYLEQTGYRFDKRKLRMILKEIHWPGRLQTVQEEPRVILDVSHNVAGMEVSLQFLQEHFRKEELHLLIGLLSDKEYKTIVELTAPFFETVTVCEPFHERKLAAEMLQSEYRLRGKKAAVEPDPVKAYKTCTASLEEGETLVVMGSHFIVGHMLQSIKMT